MTEKQTAYMQGSYESWKTWKVLKLYYGIFQDWKVLEGKSWKKASGPGSSRNLLNSTKIMKCTEGSKEN